VTSSSPRSALRRHARLLAACSLAVTACSKKPAEPAAEPAQATARALTPAQAAAGFVQRMREATAREPELAVPNRLEALHDEVRAALLVPLEKAFTTRDSNAWARLWKPGVDALAFGAATVLPVRERDGLAESTLSAATTRDPASDAARYFAELARVDDVRFDVFRVVAIEGGATVDVHFDLRAELVGGARRNDRGDLALRAERVSSGWRLTGISAPALVRVQSLPGRAPAFTVATAALGLDQVPMVERSEAIRRGGYALAVGESDHDGLPELLVGGAGPVQLFRQVNGRYVDVAAKAGLRGETLVKSAAWADFDADGHDDLALLRFVSRGEAGVGGDFSFYRNKGDGTFEWRDDVLPRSRNYDRPMPLAAADFDGNGTVDLYIGFPGARDFTNNLDGKARLPGLASQGVWLNEGGWKFSEAPPESTLVQHNQVYPHSSLATDLDQNGTPDLVVVDDSGRPSPVYRNVKAGQFAQANHELALDSGYGWGMGASSGDYDGDGQLDIVLSQVTLLPMQRIVASAQAATDLSPEMQAKAKAAQSRGVSVRLFRNAGDGTFAEVASAAGIGWVGEAAGSAEFIDYDADGRLDIYVPTGLWSGGPEDIGSTFVRAQTIMGDLFRPVDVHWTEAAMARAPNPLLEALRFHKGEAGDAAKPQLSFSGYQRNRLMRNNGDGTFTEVGYLEGADRLEDGYVVASVDYDRDGVQDLVLRNTDPAPGVRFEPLTVLHNTLPNRHVLTVQLAGAGGNRSGIGAFVTAFVGDRKLLREVRATNGAVQGEAAAVFGLGAATRVDRLTVRWPSGKVEEFSGVDAGRVVLAETGGLKRLAGVAAPTPRPAAKGRPARRASK
jgi:hypothetical protein